MTAPSIALLLSYPLPTADGGRDFHPIERALAGRTESKTEQGLPCSVFCVPAAVPGSFSLGQSRGSPLIS